MLDRSNFMQFSVCCFEDWRAISRRLLGSHIEPRHVRLSSNSSQELLFAANDSQLPPKDAKVFVPPRFIELARQVSYHRSGERWNLLYEGLWRITRNEPHLLELETDELVLKLFAMEKQVRRDCHKMKAFVRFQKINGQATEQYVAWHAPDHLIVQAVAPFFSRRFKDMQWSIFTPDESAHWDRSALSYGPGIARSAVEGSDDLESLWLTYYSSTFNPARIKIRTMKREMPVRHWRTLPETKVIDEILEDAPQRVEEMIRRTEGLSKSAADFLPAHADGLEDLAQAAQGCRGCDLCLIGTQTVFGVGPKTARLFVVGEQPGNEEDLQGIPFVGPAGRLLDKVFDEVQIDRDQVYVTNAVKHFSFEMRGKVRLHKKPTVRQTTACKPWLTQELQMIKPKVILCLGATALQSLLGREIKLTQVRGTQCQLENSIVIPTWHPAAILRSPGDVARDRRAELVEDSALAKSLLNLTD